jgi:hypothetical protein
METYETLVDFELARLAKLAGFDGLTRYTFREALFAGEGPRAADTFEAGAVFESEGHAHINGEKPFDGSSSYWQMYARPTQAALVRWLRQTGRAHLFVAPLPERGNAYTRQHERKVKLTAFTYDYCLGELWLVWGEFTLRDRRIPKHDTYELAEAAGLRAVLQALTEKSQPV